MKVRTKLGTAVAIAMVLVGCRSRESPSSTTWTTGAGTDYGTMDANVPNTSDMSGAPAGDNATSGVGPLTPVDPPSAYRNEAGPSIVGGDGGTSRVP